MNTKNINLYWIIAVLALLLIGSISKDLSQISKLTEILSFAATLSSLLLSVIAIFYAFINSESTQRNVSELNSHANKISILSQNFDQKIQQIESYFEEMPKEFKSVKDHIDETVRDNLNNTQILHPEQGRENNETNEGIGEDIIDYFFATVSLTGLKYLYVLNQAHMRKIQFKFSEIDFSRPMDEVYVHGFEVAIASMSLVDIERTDDVVYVKFLDARIGEKIEIQLVERLKYMLENPVNEYAEQDYREMIKVIEAKTEIFKK